MPLFPALQTVDSLASPVPIKIGKSELPSRLSPDFKAKSYFTMLLVLTVAMLFCSHCMFLPILFPLFHCANWVTHVVSLVLGLSLSFAITERFQKGQNNGLLDVLFFNPIPRTPLSKHPVDFNHPAQIARPGLYFSEVYNRRIPAPDLAIETISYNVQSKPSINR